MIVVDTNIIGNLYLSAEHSSLVEQLLLKDADWRAPLLWRSEMRNVLLHYLRKGILSLEDTLQIMDEAAALMQGGEYAVNTVDVLRLAAGSTLSAYNCKFVALAQDLGVSLITLDKQVQREFPDTAISLQAYIEA